MAEVQGLARRAVRQQVVVRRWGYALGTLVLALAGVILVDLIRPIEALNRALPNTVWMKAGTAVSLIFGALGLWLALAAPWRRAAAWGACLAATLVATLGAVTLTQDLFERNLGIHKLLFSGDYVGLHASLAGRMALTSAAASVLVGLAIMAARLGGLFSAILSQLMAVAVGLLSIVALTGYAYGVDPLQWIGHYPVMSLPSALGFGLLAAGLLCLRPQEGLSVLWLDLGLGGWMMRRLLAASVIVPFALGLLKRLGEDKGLYESELGTVLLVLVTMVCMGLVVMWQGWHLYAADRQRVSAQRAERRQRQWLETTLRSIGDAVIATDARGRVLLMNGLAERLTGWSTREARGRPVNQVFRVVREADHQPVSDPVMRVLREGPIIGLTDQALLMRRGGTEFPIDDAGSPIRGADGRIQGVVLIFRDVTAQREAQRALQQMNQTLEQRVQQRTSQVRRQARQMRELARHLIEAERRERQRIAATLHDHFQQILVAAKMRLEMISRALEAPTLRDGAAQVVQMLEQTIRESRTLAVELRPPILHDAGLVAALKWQARRSEQEYGFAVRVEADDACDVTDDRLRTFLFEAARELLLNVAKHAGATEAIIELKPEKNLCRLAVTDNGRGCPAGLLADEPSEENADGPTGFGLAQIRYRAEMLGGRFQMEQGQSGGCIVSLWTPLGRVVPVITQAPSKPSLQLQMREQSEPVIRVLLADDHDVVRQGLAALLEQAPAVQVVGQAADGQAAVEMTRQLKPDVVLMDVSMPRMNGVEATRQITHEWPQVRIVGLSMHSGPDMTEAMREAGAAAFLTKGCPLGELLSVLRETCRRASPEPAEQQEPVVAEPC